MPKIEKLTKEQEKYLVKFRKKWLDVGVCCDPADFDTAEKQITFFYEKLGKKKPMFFRFSSPFTAELGCQVLDYIIKNPKNFFGGNLRANLGAHLWANLGDNLRANLGANLGDNLGDNLGANLGDNLGDNLWDNLRANLRANLGDNLGANLRDNLWANLGDNLGDNLGANLGANLRANLGANLGDNLWANLGANLGDNLWANLGANLWDNLRDNLWANLGDNLGANLRANLGDNLGANLGANLRANLGDNLRDNLGANLWDNLRANLRDNLRANLRDNLWANLRDNLKFSQNFFIDTYRYWGTLGQMDAPWICFYKFCEEIGIKYKADDLKLLNAWGALSESACWWMPYENICIISDRPRFMSKDENGRLHNERRMAVEFADGWGIHVWHGTNIPREWIEEKDKLTPETALRWKNVEQRRCACEIIGWANILEHNSLNPKVIDKDEPHIGTLIQVDLPDAPQQWFLKYRCGTGRWFAESVNDKSFNTAMKANAGGNGWRGDGDPENFIPIVRT